LNNSTCTYGCWRVKFWFYILWFQLYHYCLGILNILKYSSYWCSFFLICYCFSILNVVMKGRIWCEGYRGRGGVRRVSWWNMLLGQFIHYKGLHFIISMLVIMVLWPFLHFILHITQEIHMFLWTTYNINITWSHMGLSIFIGSWNVSCVIRPWYP
jgi:hypothetical protein